MPISVNGRDLVYLERSLPANASAGMSYKMVPLLHQSRIAIWHALGMQTSLAEVAID